MLEGQLETCFADMASLFLMRSLHKDAIGGRAERNSFHPCNFLRESNILRGEDCNVPNFMEH